MNTILLSILPSSLVLVVLTINMFHRFFSNNRKSFEQNSKNIFNEISNMKLDFVKMQGNFVKMQGDMKHQNEIFQIHLDRISSQITIIDKRITKMESEIEIIKKSIETQGNRSYSSGGTMGEIQMIMRLMKGISTTVDNDNENNEDVKVINNETQG